MTGPSEIGANAGGGESGQAIVESAIVLPAMMFLTLMIMQLTMVQHAAIMTRYAAYSAARAGVVYNADKDAMEQAALIALLPTMGRTDDTTNAAQTGLRVETENRIRATSPVPIVEVTVLSPKKSDFASLGQHLGGVEIDFDDVRSAAARPNRLQIHLRYYYKMRIPYANAMLEAIFFAGQPGTYLLNQWGGYNMAAPDVGGQNAVRASLGLYASNTTDPHAVGVVGAAESGTYYFPLQDTYSMRMQSNAFIDNAGD